MVDWRSKKYLDEKIYCAYFDTGFESIRDKVNNNVRIITKTYKLISIFRETHVPGIFGRWYELKLAVGNLHAVYMLLNKILNSFHGRQFSFRSTYHHLPHGPRPIEENRKIFNELLQRFHELMPQIWDVVKLRKESKTPKYQDKITEIFIKINHNIERLHSFCELATEDFVDGKPILLQC